MEPKRLLVKLSQEQLDNLIMFLLDTDINIDRGLSFLELTADQLDPSSFDDLYSEIFKCDWCGWWWETSEDCGENCCDRCSQIKLEDENDEDIIDNEDSALDDGDDL